MSNRDVALGYVSNPPNVTVKNLRVQHPRRNRRTVVVTGPADGGTADAARALVMGGTPGGNVSFENASAPQPGQIIVATDSENAEWRDLWQLQDSRRSVRATTIVQVMLATVMTGSMIDGVTLQEGDRVLIKDQTMPATAAVTNGIYVIRTGQPPERADDFEIMSNVGGTYMIVQEGAQNADSLFVCTNNSSGVGINGDEVGTAHLGFDEIGGTGGGGGGTPLTTYSLLPIKICVEHTSPLLTVANQEWNDTYRVNYTNGKLIISVRNVGNEIAPPTSRKLRLRLDHNNGMGTTTGVLANVGIVSMREACIIMSATWTLPLDNGVLNTLSDGYLELRVRKNTSGGDNPMLLGGSLKFEVP